MSWNQDEPYSVAVLSRLGISLGSEPLRVKPEQIRLYGLRTVRENGVMPRTLRVAFEGARQVWRHGFTRSRSFRLTMHTKHAYLDA